VDGTRDRLVPQAAKREARMNLVCPDCCKSDQMTFGQNARGTWIGCIRCQNARDGYPNVPAAEAAWRRLGAKGADGE